MPRRRHRAPRAADRGNVDTLFVVSSCNQDFSPARLERYLALASEAEVTHGIRESDDTGQRTTTGRSLHRFPAGGWLVDTPGMRELQLADVKAGIEDVFADVVDIARGCRFGGCRHESEPGCAVRVAIESGALEEARYRRWRKLASEEARNSESLHERHARDRAFGRMVRRIMKDKERGRGG